MRRLTLVARRARGTRPLRPGEKRRRAVPMVAAAAMPRGRLRVQGVIRTLVSRRATSATKRADSRDTDRECLASKPCLGALATPFGPDAHSSSRCLVLKTFREQPKSAFRRRSQRWGSIWRAKRKRKRGQTGSLAGWELALHDTSVRIAPTRRRRRHPAFGKSRCGRRGSRRSLIRDLSR